MLQIYEISLYFTFAAALREILMPLACPLDDRLAAVARGLYPGEEG